MTGKRLVIFLGPTELVPQQATFARLGAFLRSLTCSGSRIKLVVLLRWPGLPGTGWEEDGDE
jgi:hypothetical protein